MGLTVEASTGMRTVATGLRSLPVESPLMAPAMRAVTYTALVHAHCTTQRARARKHTHTHTRIYIDTYRAAMLLVLKDSMFETMRRLPARWRLEILLDSNAGFSDHAAVRDRRERQPRCDEAHNIRRALECHSAPFALALPRRARCYRRELVGSGGAVERRGSSRALAECSARRRVRAGFGNI